MSILLSKYTLFGYLGPLDTHEAGGSTEGLIANHLPRYGAFTSRDGEILSCTVVSQLQSTVA